jgi:hypothetical protein
VNAAAASADQPSPFATVREMYAVKDDFLRELRAMELRLTAKIDQANSAHDAVHTDMRSRGDDRHRRIDDFLTAEQRQDAVDAALLAGRSNAYRSMIAGLRIANEFRWLIAIIVAGLLLFTNGVHLSVTAQ